MLSIQLFSLFTLVAGLALLGTGLYKYFRRKDQLARSVRTTGVVVELLPIRERGHYLVKKTSAGSKVGPKVTYRAVVEFETDAGRKIKFKANLSTYTADFKARDPVDVVYDPVDPESARINRPVYVWFEVGMLIFFGLFGIGMGLLGIWLQ